MVDPKTGEEIGDTDLARNVWLIAFLCPSWMILDAVGSFLPRTERGMWPQWFSIPLIGAITLYVLIAIVRQAGDVRVAIARWQDRRRKAKSDAKSHA